MKKPLTTQSPGAFLYTRVLQAGSGAQGVGAVGFFPGERGEGIVTHGFDLRRTTEVAIGCGVLVHRVQQVEHGGDGVWTQVEHSRTRLMILSSPILPVPKVFSEIDVGWATPMA